MPDQQTITAYYDQLAADYDADRFDNSYGRYLHAQEIALLQPYLATADKVEHLDLGCGTGRFLAFAQHGLDVSAQMIAVAQQKYPDRQLMVGDAQATPYADASFRKIFSLHVFMHLDAEKVGGILTEAHRVLKPGGYFLFDIPSRQRRRLLRYKAPSDWHGAYELDRRLVRDLIGTDWHLIAMHGIAFLPIHRLPKGLRPAFIALDKLLCRTFLKPFSSYLLFVLQKK